VVTTVSSRTPGPQLNVVLFSGGRGSGALSGQLLANRNIVLTIAINGYDDGASTGEVRRFLGDSLGPSDFRKNASRIAGQLGTCPPELLTFLDSRLPSDATAEHALRTLEESSAGFPAVRERLRRFRTELCGSGRPFDFRDCSAGNLVFAGSYLLCGRDFNTAVDDYCLLVGLPPGLVENVTDGTNAWLVAVDDNGRVLPTEESIVNGRHASHVSDIFLLGTPLQPDDLPQQTGDPRTVTTFLEARSIRVPLNPRLASAIARADLIIYAPGTQHSSLFPSYLTTGLSRAIALR